MKLGQIMHRMPVTVRSTQRLMEARDIMLGGNIRHLPVVEDDRLVGLITARDITGHQARTGESLASSPDDTVAMAMQREVETATPQTDLAEAARKMAEQKIGCLPIVIDGVLTGIVTTTDVLTAQADVQATPHLEGTVADVMTQAPQVVHADDWLFDAAARMQRLRIRHLPVIDGDGNPIGMLSDRDVRTAVGDPSKALVSGDGKRQRVSDAMSRPAITVTADLPCPLLAKRFVENETSCMPVVDKAGKVVGVVSYIDILRKLTPPTTPTPL